MFSLIVGGPIDPVAAGFALVALAVMITIIVTSFIVKRRSRREIEIEFDLAKIKLHNEDDAQKRNVQLSRERDLAEIASKRDTEFKRIESSIGLRDVSPASRAD